MYVFVLYSPKLVLYIRKFEVGCSGRYRISETGEGRQRNILAIFFPEPLITLKKSGPRGRILLTPYFGPK